MNTVQGLQNKIDALEQLLDVQEETIIKQTNILVESEARFKAIYEGSNDAIMLLTEKGFFDCNARTLEMFGFKTVEEFSRVHPADISPPRQSDGQESFPAAGEKIKTAFETGSNRFEWVHRRTDGVDFQAEVLLSAFTLNNKRVLQATVRDITKRKQAEDALVASEKMLKKKNAEVLEFTDMVTHDLKKPLSVMKTICSLTKLNAAASCDPEFIETTRIGAEAIVYMQEMLDDLLVSAKLESGTADLALEEFSFKEAVGQVIQRLKLPIEEKHISTSVCETDVRIRADARQVGRLLMNLIGNAINYIGDRPDRHISIGWEQKDGLTTFSVQDNGIGIPPETQSHLFTKFKRGANVSGISGTGLGLSIVKGIVLAHGGKIWFESKVGEGTVFHFTLG